MTKSTGRRKEITIETKRTTKILSRRTIVLRPDPSLEAAIDEDAAAAEIELLTDKPETHKEKTTMIRLIKLAVTVLITLAAATATYAAWGDRDFTFGYEGVTHDPETTNCTPLNVALQPDGRFLITGFRTTALGKRIFLRRYLENGLPDLSFGQNGWAQSSASTSAFVHYEGERIVVMNSGKIAVFGVAGGQHAVWMYNANGTSDNAFGTNGRATLSVSTNLARSGIQAAGTNLLLLFSGSASGELLMLNPSGTPQTRWGNAGSVSTGLVGTQRMYRESSTGKILVAGRISGLQKLRVKRFMSNGTADSTFIQYEIGSDEQGYGEWISIEASHLLPLPNEGVLLSYSGIIQGPGHPSFTPHYYKTISVSGSETGGGHIGWAFGNFGAIRSDGKFVTSSDSEGRFWRKSYFAQLNDLEGTPVGMFDGWNLSASIVPAVILPDDRVLVVGKTSVIAMARLTAN
ncbi:MAG TPA: hypothetical protein PKD24_14605 [Pyrinomonadaceae bacterium]|nr:hypothetical protein [Pyrinomonadaceae bacterium]HMP66604.1 hypothetical protein [Pyrinomonadaceae bacterium]